MDHNEYLTLFFQNPVAVGFGIALVMLAFFAGLAIFVKIIGSPFEQAARFFSQIFPQAFKELSGKAGWTGRINLIIVLCLFLLSLLFLIRTNIVSLIVGEEGKSVAVSLTVIFLDFITFIASLKLVADNDKTTKLMRPVDSGDNNAP